MRERSTPGPNVTKAEGPYKMLLIRALPLGAKEEENENAVVCCLWCLVCVFSWLFGCCFCILLLLDYTQAYGGKFVFFGAILHFGVKNG